jgi:metal-sulfur cluster biosynthetic enzyme
MTTTQLLVDKSETVELIRVELNTIGDPCSVAVGSPMGVEEMGLIESVDIDDDGAVAIRMRLTSPTCHMIGYFSVEMRDRLLAVPGVTAVTVTSDAGLDWTADMMSDAAKLRRAESLRRKGIVLS